MCLSVNSLTTMEAVKLESYRLYMHSTNGAILAPSSSSCPHPECLPGMAEGTLKRSLASCASMYTQRHRKSLRSLEMSIRGNHAPMPGPTRKETHPMC